VELLGLMELLVLTELRELMELLVLTVFKELLVPPELLELREKLE
jgi:hypothetical protein